MAIVRYRCPEDGLEYQSRDERARCLHPRESWEEVRYVTEDEARSWQLEVATMRSTLNGVLSGHVVRDETENGDPILLDLTPEPARVVWPR